jgi:hypothetical protein
MVRISREVSADVEDIGGNPRKLARGGGQYRLVGRSTALPFELVHAGRGIWSARPKAAWNVIST